MAKSGKREETFALRLQEIKTRLDQGMKVKQICEEMQLSQDTVFRYKKYLQDNKMLNILSKEEKMDIIVKLTKNGKSEYQIAEKLHISRNTVRRYKSKLREQNRLTGDEETIGQQQIRKKERLRKVGKILKEEEKKEERKTRDQIGEKVGVSRATIARYKEELSKQKEEEFLQWSKKIIKLYDDFEGQPTSIKKFEEYLTACKEGDEQNLIKQEHLKPIKYATMATERYPNVAFYIKLCTRFSQFEEALQFAYSYVNYESFNQEEKEKMKKLKGECEKYNQTINLLKRNTKISNEEIMRITDLPKIEVILLRKKVKQQVNKEKETKEQKSSTINRTDQQKEDTEEEQEEVK